MADQSGPTIADMRPDTSEDEFAALVDLVKRCPEHRPWLVRLLPENISIYDGRGTNATIRMKGYVLAAFEQVGLPGEALPYVLEELESGRSPYLVAAAAKALRGLEGCDGEVVPFLLEAIGNIRQVDDAVSFDGYWSQWPAATSTTAVQEVLGTLAWLGPRAVSARSGLEALLADPSALTEPARHLLESILADVGSADDTLDEGHACCSSITDAAGAANETRAMASGLPLEVELEDQDGAIARFDELVRQGPTIATFFYTRCGNPNKCSLTVTKLARLRELLARRQRDDVQVIAFTYDPAFDIPARLRAYGELRGVEFGPRMRFLRATRGFEALRRSFDLGVNFGPAVVNTHRIELFVLDGEGALRHSFTRLQWDPAEVVDAALGLVASS